MQKEALLSVEDLAFGYPERLVGSGVSFVLRGGEVLCLLGPNGGGKTTLFKTILGVLPARGGRIAVAGEEVSTWSRQRRARVFGYVPQSGGGTLAFTVFEMVLMGRTAHHGPFSAPTREDREAAEAAIEGIGISHLARREWTRISGGERQLALIARALAQGPQILVLDEPTANLDFGNQLRVIAELRRLAERGLAVFFSTHHPEQAFAIADEVAILHGGRLAELGPPEKVITAATMLEIYGAEVDVLSVGGGRFRVCVPRALT
jgi:iron complex transport system ATP-binding protein